MGRVVYIVYHYNSVKNEFSFAISSAELRPTLLLVLGVCTLFSLSSSTSSHRVVGNHSAWSATVVSGRLTRVGDQWANILFVFGVALDNRVTVG